jgi:hypothetical protein
MYHKHNQTWNKESNYTDTEQFIELLEKLKTYSKSLSASGYSITNSLDDVYQSQGFQAELNSTKNLFTSDKVIKKWLKNFHVVDLASTRNVDITKTHPIVLIDGTKVANGQRVLLKNQTDAVENGVYLYTNKEFKLDKTFKSVEDYYLFYVFIQYGSENINKQFLLKRDENGYFPELENNKEFIEGTNYIIRNRISYKLLRNHQLNDSVYFTEKAPNNINVDFTDRAFVGNDFYIVSEDRKKLLFVSNTITHEYILTGYEFLNKVDVVDSTAYVVGYNDASVYKLFKLNSGVLELVRTFDDKLVDFKILNNMLDVAILPQNELGWCEIVPSGGIYYYLTSNTIETDRGVVLNVKNPSKLRIEVVGDTTHMYYLDRNKNANKLSINTAALSNMYSIDVDIPYNKLSYSKSDADSIWKIEEGDLYLKGNKITNLNEDEYINIPKISKGLERTYDGINSYSLLSTKSFTESVKSDKLSIEFTIKPQEVHDNISVFYIGTKGDNENAIPTQSSSYITFLIKGEDDFPCLIISTPEKSITIKSNKKINSERVSVSFTYHYSNSSAVGKLYFNGILVGSLTDQANTLTRNKPIHLREIKSDVFYLAKSELSQSFYYGDISEFKIWNMELNSAQIKTRLNLPISNKDIHYSNLKGYWKLSDIIGVHKEEIYGNVDTETNIYYGGLNLDNTLRELHNVVEIQRSDSNLYVLSNNEQTSTVYSIDLRDESVSELVKFSDTNLKSIHFDAISGKLYYLHNNTIYHNTIEAYSTTDEFDDFTVVDGLFFIVKKDNKLYNTSGVVYNTAFSNVDKIYAEVANNKINVYIDEITNGYVATTLLSASYDSVNRTYASFEYVTKYPFTSNKSIGDYRIENNQVYKNSILIDTDSNWTVNLKKISSISVVDNVLYVLVTTVNNNVHLWSYKDGRSVKFADTSNNPTLALAKGEVDFKIIGKFLLLTNTDSLTWFKILDTNKLHSVYWTHNVSEHYNTVNVVAGKVWLGNDTHIAQVKSNSLNYGVWENSLTYDYKNNGLLVGDNGLILSDDALASVWSVNSVKSVYRANFNAVEACIENTMHNKGYVINTWSGLSWVVGDSGSIIKSKDGINWSSVESGVNHKLTSVSFFDKKTGIVSGENGTLLSTFTGDSFEQIALEDSVKDISWNKVLIYQIDKAIVLGIGAIIHLTRKGNKWVLDRISNTDVLEDFISLRFNEGVNSDTYKHSFNDLVYLGVGEFIVVGQQGLVCKLMLENKTDHKKAHVTILNTNRELDWKQVVWYDDKVVNERNLLLTSALGVYKLHYDKITDTTVNITKFISDTQINKISYWGSSDIVSLGKRASLKRHTLHTHNGSEYVASVSVSNHIERIKSILKPKMLFLDYYLGRKINLHLDNGNYELPSGSVVIPSTTNMVEFTPYGRELKDNNFLAYQDFYFMNKRSAVSFGQMDGVWLSYNKKFTKTTTPSAYKSIATINSTNVANSIHSTTISEMVTKITAPIGFAQKKDVVHILITNGFTTVFDDVVIIKDVLAGGVLVLVDLFNGDMIADFKGCTLEMSNLNYFDGSTKDLENKIKKHLIGQSYSITSTENGLFVEGIVNELTKYYNLETNVKVDNTVYPILYSDDTVYGTQYNLLSFLSNVNPAFTKDYDFGLPYVSYNYNNVVNSGGLFKEFTITNNRIFVGCDLVDIKNLKEGLFYDIERGASKLTKVYLSKIEVSVYEQYPDKKRYILYFDQELEDFLVSGTTTTISARGKLSQISKDLEFTDNVMFPLTNSEEYKYLNKSYYNQTRTAAAYADYIISNSDIRENISSVICLDSDGDWNISILNWYDDSNLVYQPVDLHTLGVDKAFRKAVSITPKNLSTDTGKFKLINVDMDKYNFKLVNGVSLKDIEEKYNWVLNADIKNAVLGEDKNGLVWYEGDWIAGVWEGGTWYSGKAYNIEWVMGEVYSYQSINNYNIYSAKPSDRQSHTVWYSGVFLSGAWHNGVLINGTWYNGVHHNGLFIGTWHNGVWHNGHFQGTWHDGTWYNGKFSETNATSVWHLGTWLGGDFENGVWRCGTWDESLNIPSRFGTKASLLHNAVWEYGHWKNGQFHSGLETDQIKNSVWYNGVWENGVFHGGVWKYGLWYNGHWKNGIWASELDIQKITPVHTTKITGTQITFNMPHYYKECGIDNYFVIIGEASDNRNGYTDLLGHNTNYKKHKIIEIVDEYTIIADVELDKVSFSRFDYAIVRYHNNLDGGVDLDTRTAIVDLDISVNEQTVGWNYSNYIGLNASDYYLRWGGDNTSTGVESVLVNFENISRDYPDAKFIYIRLRAFWYASVNNGKISLEFETYRGGEMTQVGYDFKNTGGKIADTLTVERTVTETRRDNNMIGQDLAMLVYDTTKKTAAWYGIETDAPTSGEVDDKSIPMENLGYTDKPLAVSYWEDGTWFGGIWIQGYHRKGYWKGGIWIDGVHDDGEFGE